VTGESEAQAEAGRRSGNAGADLTSGPIVATLLAFALPTLGSNVLQSLNGTINAVWVGQLLGRTAVAAMANAHLVMFAIYSLTFGLAMAAMVIVGQTMGRRDIAGVRRVVGAVTSLYLVLGTATALACWIAAPQLLAILGTPPEVHSQALIYMRILLLGLPPSLLMLAMGMILRGIGDSVTPFRFMIAATVMDALFNPLFILGLGPLPGLGIAGSAMANTVGNYLSTAALLIYIYRKDLPIRLRGSELRYLRPNREIVSLLLVKGVPMGLQMIIVSLASLVLMVLVNAEGTAAIAAYGAVNQLWTYLQLPAFAISSAVSVMAAQNIGAGAWGRVDRVAMTGVAVNLLLSGALFAVILLFDRQLLALLIPGDPVANAIGRHINLIAGWSFVLAGLSSVYTGVTRANGAVMAPLLILAVAMIPVRIGIAYALQPALGAEAIWWSLPAGAAVAALLTAAYYYYGRWRELPSLAPASPEDLEELAMSEAAPTGRLHPSA
jgi:putative MATE family efflux protein